MKLLIHLLLLIGLSGLTGSAIVGHQAADLSAIKGADANGGPVNDLADLLGQSTIKRSAPVEISEADLNRYLATTLRGKQGGSSGRVMNFERVLIDLEQGYAHVTLCWLTEKHRTTATIDLVVRTKDGRHEFQIVSGAYGRMPVARGFLAPLMPAINVLTKSSAPEIRSILNMTKIHLVKDKLVLDPRY